MHRIVFDKDLDDDDWREANFSEAELTAARASNTRQPSAEELIKGAKKYGPEGILESAILLRQFEFQKVARALAQMKGGK